MVFRYLTLCLLKKFSDQNGKGLSVDCECEWLRRVIHEMIAADEGLEGEDLLLRHVPHYRLYSFLNIVQKGRGVKPMFKKNTNFVKAF